jgi:hypothetical protein
MAVVGAFAWLWVSHLPNAAARKLEALYASRPSVDDADNAFIDVYGFSAPAGVDAHTHGARRLAWLRRMHRDPEASGEDPGDDDFESGKLRTRAAQQIFTACRESQARACAEALRQLSEDQPLSTQEALLMERYRGLLGRGAWREEPWHSVSDRLPSYQTVLDAQRISLIRLRPASLRGDTAALRDALQRDLVFWRRVQKSTDGLIGKMIAIAAIRQHFTFANLLLRELPPGKVMDAVPPSWREPLSDEERSMWRVMAGEYAFSRTAAREMYTDEGVAPDDNITSETLDRVLVHIRRRVEPPRMLNQIALLYESVARNFEVPLHQYLQARSAVAAASRIPDEATHTATYSLRVGDIEGMRRAALLTAQLRSLAVPEADVPAELRKSVLRTPFEEQPFGWDASERAVAYEGHTKARRALVLVY